jgi:hypothetical protein
MHLVAPAGGSPVPFSSQRCRQRRTCQPFGENGKVLARLHVLSFRKLPRPATRSAAAANEQPATGRMPVVQSSSQALQAR